MDCRLCKKTAKNRESYYTLSWADVDQTEYKQRKKDGRTPNIHPVCPRCIEKYTGRPPLGLRDLNEIRKRDITKEKYYKEHGY